MKTQNTCRNRTFTDERFWCLYGGQQRVSCIFSFLKRGGTINSDKYYQEIHIMYEKLRIQQLALVNRRGVLLFHDNA